MGLTISKEEVAELPIEFFAGRTIVVDHESKVEKAVADLMGHSKLGFDTETKPSFKRGQVHKVALMQLSTINTCYLFRLNKIGYPDALDDIICNPDIKKIGLSLRDDFAAIRKRSDKKPQNFIDLQSFVDEYGIDDNGLQRIYAILFGKKISKNQRLSNWEASYLTEPQKNYAAMDAWACLRIYNHLITNGNK
ncbi:MAG: 3'-5' exonuclease [Petrimonas sp.]|uniref:3'-5' exonuclease n=1 Tax=Petrimonas sp. TaxID=2023866 RepID=UPI00095CFBA7|nr:3'-5' exonuclease [Petrimonas sp.]MEA5063213.1 3'-5' exonuclease [Petrimonas sp.]OJV35687.1 MAG: 3'-5' exonuclease [Bacteroidia bacterium 43-41]